MREPTANTINSGVHYHRWLAREIVDKLFPTMALGTRGALMRAMVPILREKLRNMTVDIREFHERFEIGYDGPPRNLPADMLDFRVKFMQEELDEYRESAAAGDLEGQFDALVDLAYVLLGTAYLQGFPFAKGWSEVHRANMTKTRAPSADASKRGSAYDVVKPSGWTPPQMMALLKEAEREHKNRLIDLRPGHPDGIFALKAEED